MASRRDRIESAIKVFWGDAPNVRDCAARLIQAAERGEGDMALKKQLADFHARAFPDERVTDGELNEACDKTTESVRKVMSEHA